MLIEVRCQNVTGFDPSTGRSEICGHTFNVDSNQIGESVPCPRCQNATDVLAPRPPRAASKGTANQPRRDVPSKAPQAARSVGSAPKRRSSSGKPRSPAANHAVPANRVTRANDAALPDTDAMSPDAQLAGAIGTRCSKCGHAAPYGRCSHCRHIEKRYLKMHAPLEKIKIQKVGLQRWFCDTLSEGFPLPVLAMVSHAAVAIPSFFLIVLGILSLAGMAFETTMGIILLVGVGLLDLFYVGLVYKGHQFMRDPKARLAWFQRPFWYLLLVLARLFQWESYDQRLKNRRVITIRDRDFTDYGVGQLEGIRTVQVLDLDGTQVTDQTVAALYRLEHLQCLVVRHTDVTHEAVFRLQQTFPKLWVWY